MKIYIVTGGAGQYEDRYTWIVKAYTRREFAEAHAAALERRLKAFYPWNQIREEQTGIYVGQNMVEEMIQLHVDKDFGFEEWVESAIHDLDEKFPDGSYYRESTHYFIREAEVTSDSFVECDSSPAKKLAKWVKGAFETLSCIIFPHLNSEEIWW